MWGRREEKKYVVGKKDGGINRRGREEGERDGRERLLLVSKQFLSDIFPGFSAATAVEHSKPIFSRQKHLPCHHPSLTHAGGSDLLPIFHPIII